MSRAYLLTIVLALVLLPSNVVAAVVPLLRTEWGASAAEVGWVFAAYQAGYVVGVLFLLPMTDRVRTGTVLVWCTVVAAVSFVLFPFLAEGVWSASALRFLAGLGLAGIYMPGVRLVSDFAVPERRGFAVGFYVSAFYLGSGGLALGDGAAIERSRVAGGRRSRWGSSPSRRCRWPARTVACTGVMSGNSPETPPELDASVREASSIAVLTGSGISVESGVPTFREAQTGLWKRYDPQQLATPEAFDRDPRLVWEWYGWRRKLVSEAEPNPGHLALAQLERRFSDFTLVTQNVDGLHQRAGSRGVIELHGNILRSKCSREGVIVEPEDQDESVPPRCSRCGAFLRPDVVWFGEMLPAAAFEAASEATRRCDLFLSVGTSSLVYPAAGLPYEALENGATLVEINPGETPLTRHADHVLRGQAGEVLPELVRGALSPPSR